MRKIIITVMLVIVCITANAAVEDTLVVKQILDYYACAQRERVTIMTDRDVYHPENQVWFRVFVTDLPDNTESQLSDFVYLDLYRNETWKVVQHKKIICNEKGIFANSLYLPDDIVPGEYTLVGYTKHMVNFPDNNFCFKRITIAAPEKSETGEKKLSIVLSPEGQHYIEGQQQKIGIKVTDEAAQSVTATVEVTDTTGTVVATTSTNSKGYASIDIVNEYGSPLMVKATNPGYEPAEAIIPEPEIIGAAIRIDQDDDVIKLKVLSTPNFPIDDYNIVVRASGVVLSVQATQAEKVMIPLSMLPAGQVDIDLIDVSRGKVESTRSLIVPSKKTVKVEVVR